MSRLTSIAVPSEDSLLEVSSDGGATWLPLTGTAGYTESGGTNPTRESRTFASINSQVGKASLPTVSVTIEGYAALHSTYQMIGNAQDNRTTLNWRFTTLEDEVRPASTSINSPTVGVATSGTATFAARGTGGDSSLPQFNTEQFAQGMALKIPGSGNTVTYYIIENITDAGVHGTISVVNAMTKVAPTNAVSATPGWSIVVPAERRPSFSAKITNADKISADVDGFVSTTLEIAPLTQLPRIVIGV